MNRRTLLVVALMALIQLNCNATLWAAPIVLTGTQTQTVDGQNFVFTFPVAPAALAGGSFILHAQGDYDGATSESLTWSIEGVVSGGPVGGFVGGVGIGGPFDFFTVFQPLGNLEFQRTYGISAVDLATILADGMVTITVDLASDVGLFNPPNFVQVTLTYEPAPVPEPTSIAIWGLAAAGFIVSRLRKSQISGKL